jgi:putative ATP-dependent endonuclease of OLD family
MTLSASPIVLSYNDSIAEWNMDENGQLRLLFQKAENGYQSRSFEDAFICNNLQFIIDNKDNFMSLKNISTLETDNPNYYDIADQCIDSKTSFALDILLYGGKENEKWTTPLYIKEGLEWLAQ